jgi:hypothetical protein
MQIITGEIQRQLEQLISRFGYAKVQGRARASYQQMRLY